MPHPYRIHHRSHRESSHTNVARRKLDAFALYSRGRCAFHNRGHSPHKKTIGSRQKRLDHEVAKKGEEHEDGTAAARLLRLGVRLLYSSLHPGPERLQDVVPHGFGVPVQWAIDRLCLVIAGTAPGRMGLSQIIGWWDLDCAPIVIPRPDAFSGPRNLCVCQPGAVA
jgi:hypothetical protein